MFLVIFNYKDNDIIETRINIQSFEWRKMEIIASKQSLASLAEMTQQEAWDPRSQVVPVWWYGIGMAVKEKDVDSLDCVSQLVVLDYFYR